MNKHFKNFVFVLVRPHFWFHKLFSFNDNQKYYDAYDDYINKCIDNDDVTYIDRYIMKLKMVNLLLTHIKLCV